MDFAVRNPSITNTCDAIEKLSDGVVEPYDGNMMRLKKASIQA